MIALAASEAVIGASGVAARIEAMLPSGARARQLAVRTLLLGMMLALADGRPAHLTRVRQALTALPEDDQRRLGVLADWKHGPHLLTYRQAEYTFGLIARALGKDQPDGGTAGTTCCTTKTSCSSATTCRTRSQCPTSRGRPCLSSPAA